MAPFAVEMVTLFFIHYTVSCFTQFDKVPVDNVVDGLNYTIFGSHLNFSGSEFRIETNVYLENATIPSLAEISVPSTISSVISDDAEMNSTTLFRISIYSTPALFISRKLQEKNAENGFNETANTPVVSFTIGEREVSGLSESINFTFTTLTVNK